ncbi:MAG: hypothetical protein NC206_10230 [Bacteroides sp.]|nr:hypothetical protein [Roseburia sp.]MCM1347444.1 hypothetical protein [Bacteroides sp.]MCM1422161.1 hypothetical protein [Bacteroides sp.]
MKKTTLGAFSIILSCTIVSLDATAQSFILGYVQDAFLKIPLPEAKISLLAADSTVVIESIPVKKRLREDGTVRDAEFSFSPERKTCNYLIRATLDGYEDGWQLLSIGENERRPVLLDNPIELRRVRQIDLDEVEIKATRVKMYWKGDTIVYDAAAFKLPDGSMLDDLIRQMPGVTIDNYGVISVNGRRIDELQLGSRSFMGGNTKVMLENLPYYVVKDIKVYEQDTDLNRAMNAKVEDKKFVMDVNLKPEFQIGYMANVEAAGGTEDRWLGRAFLLGFTKCWRYTLLANGNNVNESRHVGSSDHWTPATMPQSLLTTHSVAGEADYQSVDRNVQNNLHFDYTSASNENETRRRNELFLEGNPLSVMRSKATDKNKNLRVSNEFKFIKPESFLFNAKAEVSYKSQAGTSGSATEQFMDSLTIRQQNDGFGNGDSWAAHFDAGIKPKMKNAGRLGQFLSFSALFDYSSDERQSAGRYVTQNFVHPSVAKQYNSGEYTSHRLDINVPLQYGLLSSSNMFVTFAPAYSHKRTHDWLYHPDTLLSVS